MRQFAGRGDDSINRQLVHHLHDVAADSRLDDWNKFDWANLRQLIVAVAVFGGLVAIGVYVIGKIRGQGRTTGTAGERIADKIPGIAFPGCAQRRRIPNNKNYVDEATAKRVKRTGATGQ